MSAVFVVTTASTTANPSEPRIAYVNSVVGATLLADDNNADIEYVRDGLTTLKWRPGVTDSGIRVGEAFTGMDYAALVGVNWASAGASLSITNNGSEIAAVSGLRDNQPVFFAFDAFNAGIIRFEFSCTNTTLEVGEIYLGQSITLPRNVSTGYQPGRWSNNDETSFSRTVANQFGPSTTQVRGSEERFKINFVTEAFLNTTYAPFVRNATGKPIFFLWNKANADQCVFGHWTASAPRFDSSLYGSIDMTIAGVA